MISGYSSSSKSAETVDNAELSAYSLFYSNINWNINRESDKIKVQMSLYEENHKETADLYVGGYSVPVIGRSRNARALPRWRPAAPRLLPFLRAALARLCDP